MRLKTCFCAGAVLVFLAASAWVVHADEAAAPGRHQRQPGRTVPGDYSREAREKMGERIHEIEKKRAQMSEAMREEREKIRELVIKHRRAETEQEKAAITEELQQLIEAGFNRRHDALHERLEDLREACRNIEGRLKENLERKDEIISGRVESLLQPHPGRGGLPEDRGRGIVREREN